MGEPAECRQYHQHERHMGRDEIGQEAGAKNVQEDEEVEQQEQSVRQDSQSHQRARANQQSA